ncbi:hypothetical protein M513_04561 [Trichuris suis]|uniref:Uncharacterized protein n=1 Tax=Trichuris suis TaxID=68888 RepID=A0A085MBM0_9BILA|nr:hypothetical protein M513_04561 [Trichuris suis]
MAVLSVLSNLSNIPHSVLRTGLGSRFYVRRQHRPLRICLIFLEKPGPKDAFARNASCTSSLPDSVAGTVCAAGGPYSWGHTAIDGSSACAVQLSCVMEKTENSSEITVTSGALQDNEHFNVSIVMVEDKQLMNLERNVVTNQTWVHIEGRRGRFGRFNGFGRFVRFVRFADFGRLTEDTHCKPRQENKVLKKINY